MLKFRRTPGIFSYSSGKHYLDPNEFNFGKYLNAMVRELKYYSHQAKKSRGLQYLSHSYTGVSFISIFQNLVFDCPFLHKFYIFAIEVPILHFLVLKDQCSEYDLKSQNRTPAGGHGTQVPMGGNKSCTSPNGKYEVYQLYLGNLVKVLSLQGIQKMEFLYWQ